jgi:hypothetical protein
MKKQQESFNSESRSQTTVKQKREAQKMKAKLSY